MKDQWLIDHGRRAVDGTYKRIDAVVEDRIPVKIRRSSGEMVSGYVLENARVVAIVAWGVGAEGWSQDGCCKYRLLPGVMSKTVKVDDLLAWNPDLGAPP